MSMKCVKCGSDLRENAKFCTNCGCVVETAAPVAAQQIASQSADKKVGAGAVLLSVILVPLIIVLGMYASLGLSVRIAAGGFGVRNMVNDLDIADLEVDSRGMTLAESIYDMLYGSVKRQISERDLEKLLNESFVKAFVTEQVTGYFDEIFGHKGEGIIELDEMEEFFEENHKKIEKTLDIDFDEDVWEIALAYLDVQDFEEESDITPVLDEEREAFDMIAIVCSYLVLIPAALLACVFALFVLKLCRKRPGAFTTVGICSLFISLSHFAMLPLLSMAKDAAKEEGAPLEEILLTVSAYLGRQELVVGVVFVVLFVAFVICAGVAKKKMPVGV